MNEPKNPIREILLGFVNLDHLDRKVEEIESYLRSLVGEKGREALAGIICDGCFADQECYEPEHPCKLAKDTADSLAPIIAAQIAEGVEKEREAIEKEGRQEVVEWIVEHSKHPANIPSNCPVCGSNMPVGKWQAQLKSWGIEPKEGEG